jgi:hypothetical protein
VQGVRGLDVGDWAAMTVMVMLKLGEMTCSGLITAGIALHVYAGHPLTNMHGYHGTRLLDYIARHWVADSYWCLEPCRGLWGRGGTHEARGG